MYYDPLRNAYVDPSDGSIIPTEDGDDIPYAVYSFPEEFHELEHISTKQDSSRSPQNGAISLEEELFSLHVSDNLAARNEQDSNDWTFARSLQALEFEISNDMLNGIEDGDFNEKEYYAFKSCRRQLLTISFFICVGQVKYLI